jgi:hypothetical protein
VAQQHVKLFGGVPSRLSLSYMMIGDGNEIASSSHKRSRWRMECVERARLQKNYTTARAILDAARARVQQRIEICQKSDFLVLSNALAWAATELKRARAAHDAHYREQCCRVIESNRIEEPDFCGHGLPRGTCTSGRFIFGWLDRPLLGVSFMTSRTVDVRGATGVALGGELSP